jgi:SprB repeat/Protein of unknown function (DUF1573)
LAQHDFLSWISEQDSFPFTHYIIQMIRITPFSVCLLLFLLQTSCFSRLGAMPIAAFAPSGLKPDFPTGLAEIELRGNGLVILDGDLSADTSDGTDFGSILACNGSVARSFVIHNLGLDTLVLSGLAITGSGVVSASALPGSIAPGQSHTFTLTFDPAAVGLLQATVTISSNDVDEASFAFGIACTGLADVTPPTALCRPDTIYLDQNGDAILDATQVNNNSSDNCGVVSLTLSQSTFDCQHSTEVVILTVTDASGNTATCSANVLVEDTIPPTVTCPATWTEYLDGNGIAVLSLPNYYLGSADNCGLKPTQAISHYQFICGSTQTYTETVVVIVGDSRGNNAACSTFVTVIEGTPPTIYACPPQTVTLGANGTATLPPIPGYIHASYVYDNCQVASVVLNPSTFTCADVGVNPAVIIATDNFGLTTTCSTTVTVTQPETTTAVCQSTTLYLGAGGTATLSASNIDGGSLSGCGQLSFAVTPSAFNCNQTGIHPATLTVTDLFGSTSACSTTVMVVDTISPALSCAPTVYVTLGPQGTATPPAATLVQSATDNCTISSLVTSQTIFTCADSAGSAVTITASDPSGNTQSCIVTVIVDMQPLSAMLNPVSGSCGYQVGCAAATDGVVHAVVSGGCPPYSYLWSNGATALTVSGLGVGVYTVTVTDALGVSTTQTVTLTAPPPLSAQVVAMTPACVGTSTGALTTAVAGGNACLPYQYLWSNGDTSASLQAAPPGNYILTVTSGPGCNAILTGSVAGLPLPVPVVTQIGNTLQASPGYVGYQWYYGSNPVSSATQQNFSPAIGGVFGVAVTDSNGCIGASAQFTYVPVGIRAGDPELDALVLYPNPTDGNFLFRIASAIEEPITVTVTSLLGQQLGAWQLPWLRGGEVFGVSHLAAGVYLVELRREDGSRKVFQLLRE